MVVKNNIVANKVTSISEIHTVESLGLSLIIGGKKVTKDEAIEAFENDIEVLYGFITDGYVINPNEYTILHSRFMLEEVVYFMRNDKVTQGVIKYISLSTGRNNAYGKEFIVKELYQRINPRKPYTELDFNFRDKLERQARDLFSESYAVVKFNGAHEAIPLYKIFKTKQDLLDSL